MPRYQRQYRQRQSSPNREWAGLAQSAFTSLAAASKVLTATFTLSNPGIDETILRIHGAICVQSDQAGALEEQLGAVGLCLVTDRAVTVGITAIPDPVTEVDDDFWFVYRPFMQSSTQGVDQGQTSFYYEIDSKGKRIVSQGHTVAIVVANASPSHGIEFAINLRMLSMTRGTH